jgi:hypothetical protein
VNHGNTENGEPKAAAPTNNIKITAMSLVFPRTFRVFRASVVRSCLTSGNTAVIFCCCRATSVVLRVSVVSSCFALLPNYPFR